MDHTVHDPDPNTLLAMQRNVMASDRTLMAWIRTSLSLIGFGFTLAKVFQSLAEEHVIIRGPAGNIWTAQAVGMALLILGVFALVAAIFDHHHDLKQLRAAGRRSIQPADSRCIGAAIVGCMGLR
jgi:putative membrane protein